MWPCANVPRAEAVKKAKGITPPVLAFAGSDELAGAGVADAPLSSLVAQFPPPPQASAARQPPIPYSASE